MHESVLITGAAGFLGSHLCERFIKDGFKVYAMDNLITGSMSNLEHLSNNKHFNLDQRTLKPERCNRVPTL